MGINGTPQPGQLVKIWSPEDYAEFERHVGESMALTKAVNEAKAIHPATLSKQLNGTHPPVADSRPSCEVIDLFTRTRVR